MEILRAIDDMRGWSERERLARRRIAFVPTMGYLHRGHLQLVSEARRRAERVVVSIFVNPIQFGPGEDFDRYPRDLERDERLAREAGTDVLFVPELREMYPPGFETHVEVERATRRLCGASRPGHFRGVTTVLTKLFHIVQPHVAVFGEKDFQQLAVVRRMVRDLDFGIEIVGVPTVREEDGLATSSRNVYLRPEERRAALALPRALAAAREAVARGEKDGRSVLAAARRVLESEPQVEIDYVELADPETIEEVEEIAKPTLLALAARVGSTRLIDNCVLSPPGADTAS
ncbi:MAG: pantothenate synthetase [Candidatus Binatia bacterium]|nr:MAG: pantothenate synthetase [Candidatus Binatia bacterium]